MSELKTGPEGVIEPTEPQNTDVQKDNIAALQALLDETQENLAKASKKATDQEKARKKLEQKLKNLEPKNAEGTDAGLLEANERIRVLTESLEAATAANEALKTGKIEGKLAEALIKMKDSIAPGAGSLVSKEALPHLKLIDGKITVVTDKGTPRLIAVDGGRQMKVTELIQEILTETPCLAKATLKPGGKAKSNTAGIKNYINKEEYSKKSSAERAALRKTMSAEQLAALD